MGSKTHVFLIEIVNKDKLLLGEYYNFLELVNLSTMQTLHLIKLGSWINYIMKLEDDYLIAT